MGRRKIAMSSGKEVISNKNKINILWHSKQEYALQNYLVSIICRIRVIAWGNRYLGNLEIIIGDQNITRLWEC